MISLTVHNYVVLMHHAPNGFEVLVTIQCPDKVQIIKTELIIMYYYLSR